jgi:hypothetical protein
MTKTVDELMNLSEVVLASRALGYREGESAAHRDGRLSTVLNSLIGNLAYRLGEGSPSDQAFAAELLIAIQKYAE